VTVRSDVLDREQFEAYNQSSDDFKTNITEHTHKLTKLMETVLDVGQRGGWMSRNIDAAASGKAAGDVSRPADLTGDLKIQPSETQEGPK
jgi:hypothetical protein